MKFPDSSFPSVSFDVLMGFQSFDDPKKETVKYLTSIDGTLQVVDYGARQEKTCMLQLVKLSNTEFVQLVDYLQANEGEKFRITEENTGEKFFTESFPESSEAPTTYYVRLLEHGQYQEEDFSTTRELFTLSLKFVYAGTPSTSYLDYLIKIDTIKADVTQNTTPGTTYNISGKRWYNPDNNELRRYNSSTATWDLLYTVAADDTTIGWVEGAFYLAAFSDTTYGGYTYKAGFINYGSIRLDKESIQIVNGPNMAYKQGFTFSLISYEKYDGTNYQKFWKYIIDQNISFFGAKCEFYFYNYNGGNPFIKKERAGLNHTTGFSYTDYTFDVSPKSLTQTEIYPNTVIEDEEDGRYEDVITQSIGQPPFVTYGRWEKALLQNISKVKEIISVSREYNGGITAETVIKTWIKNASPYTTLLINNTALSADKLYTFTSQQLTDINDGSSIIEVLTDTRSGQPDGSEIRLVESISLVAGYYELVLDAALTNQDLSDHLEIGIMRGSYRYQIDDEKCGGFGTISSDTLVPPIKLYKLDPTLKEFQLLPSTDFIPNSDNNFISLKPKIAAASGKLEVYKEVEGTNQPVVAAKFSPIVTNNSGARAVNHFDEATYPLPAGAVSAFKWQDLAQNLGGLIVGPYYNYAFGVSFPSPAGYPTITQTINFSKTDGTNLKTSFVNKINPTGGKNEILLAFDFPINHSEDSTTGILTASNRKLCVDFGIISKTTNVFTRLSATPPSVYRSSTLGFSVELRFIKNDGTEVKSASWFHDVAANGLGLPGISMGGGISSTFNKSVRGQTRITNFPSGSTTDDGFEDGTPTFENLYNNVHICREWGHPLMSSGLVELGNDNWPTLITGKPAHGQSVNGDLICVKNASGVLKIYKYELSPNDSYSFYADPAPGDIIYTYLPDGTDWHLYYPTLPERPADTFVNIYNVIAGGILGSSISPNDFTFMQALRGRDLFELDTLFSGRHWSDVVGARFIFALDDYTVNNPWSAESTITSFTQEFELIVNQAPKLYTFEAIEVSDKPLFSDVEGRVGEASSVDGSQVVMTSAKDICTDIMERIYPNQYDTIAFANLFDLTDRKNWKFRRQFTGSGNVETIFKEMLLNLWAVAVLDENDKWKVVSLNPADNQSLPPNHRLSDSFILKDSIQNVQFKNTDKIKQSFKLLHHYQPVSQLSKAFREYRDVTERNFENTSGEIHNYIAASENLYGFKNEYVKEFIYHYVDGDIPLVDWVVKWFALNGWTFDVALNIKSIMGASDNINYMDKISVKSSFFTDNEVIEGYVIEKLPLIYDGIVQLMLYVPRPPGVRGPLGLDPYNDALHIETRDISTWTFPNGKRNDAGNIVTRTIGDYTQKDAGNIATRSF